MKLKIDYLDNIIEIIDGQITVIEIENKSYFYRIVKSIYEIEKCGFSENVTFFDDKDMEKSMFGKLKVYVNYFELDFDSKKLLTDINKYLCHSIEQEENMTLQKNYKNLVNSYKKILNNVDIPLTVDEEFRIDNLMKILKFKIRKQEDLINNLFLIIDIENMFKQNNILVFVNLKQYLNKVELNELYKYAIYNQIKIMLVDSWCYGGTQEYEKKLIIDENLEEFML